MTRPKKNELVKKCKPAEVQQVVGWILTGAGMYEIYEAIETTFPESSPAALLKEAMDSFEQAANFNPEVVRGWCFEAARDLYRRMVETGDYPGALRAVKQIAEIAKNVYRDQDADAEDEGQGTPAAIQ
jgi:hypothetical protein